MLARQDALRAKAELKLANVIADEAIRRQAWKYYFVMLAWPAFIFVFPWALAHLKFFAIVPLAFPGLYLFTWAGYLMHESWHNYVPNVPNHFFYNLFSLMLITDPQVYKMLHGHHHMEVNSWEDGEFHPAGKIERTARRRLYNFFEIAGGVAFLVLVSLFFIPRHSRYRDQFRWGKLLLSSLAWLVFLGGLGAAAHFFLGVNGKIIVLADALLFWAGSFLLHHSQLVEHGNLIVKGEWNVRNLRTRNLRRRTPAEKLFLFLTHGDAAEHVLHHTQVKVHSRPFPGAIPLPAGAVVITLREYLNILASMLAGHVEEQGNA